MNNSIRYLFPGFILLTILLAAPLSFASEAQLDDSVVSYDAKGVTGSLTEGFKRKTLRAALKDRSGKDREGMDPFFKDTSLKLHSRTYLFDRERIDDAQNEAVATGGSIEYASGQWNNFLSIGTEVFTSQKIEGDKDKDGTLLLKPGQEGYTVVGTGYLKLQWEELEATVFRQKLYLPYVNIQDSRMTPRTFEAYTVAGDYEKFDFIAGHVTKIKERNASKFIDVGQAATGAEKQNRGLSLFGVQAHLSENFLIGAINHIAWDVLNIAYVESEVHHAFDNEFEVKWLGQFTHQKSIGNEILGDTFDTHVYGSKVALGYKGIILTGAFSVTDESERIRNPFGSYPGFISLMQKDFNRAGEEAWLVGLSTDFRNIGFKGLSAFMNYASGKNALDSTTGAALNDQNEFNVTVDYRFSEESFLKNFWVRARAGFLEEETPTGDITGHDYRLILNYTYDLL